MLFWLSSSQRRGAKSIVMQISIVMLIFIFFRTKFQGEEQKSSGGKRLGGGASLPTNCGRKPVLDFYFRCLATLKKRNLLQVTADMLHSLQLPMFSKFAPVVVEGRGQLYFVQLLQAQKPTRQVAERALAYCSYPLTCLTKPLQQKLQ